MKTAALPIEVFEKLLNFLGLQLTTSTVISTRKTKRKKK